MPNSRTKRLVDLDKRRVWHPFTQMKDWLSDPEPLVIEKGKGATLTDTQGRRYLDAVSSLWVTTHGHSHPHLQKAIARQLKQLQHSTLLGLANVPSIELADALIKVAPKGLEKVFYSDSGATAMEIALKIAYQYWHNRGESRRKKFVTFKEAYHGDTIGSVSLGGMDLFHKVYRPLLFKTLNLPTPYAPLRKGESARDRMKPLAKLLAKRHREVAALVVEPLVQGAAGILCAPKGLLREMRRLCTKHGVFLIADEVATGFGRTGKMFACEHEGVRPDLMAVAKGITGGTLPLAATLVSKKVYQGFLYNYEEQKTFFHGHTYTGNPLACAAAIANLELFKKERTLQKIQPRIKQLDQGLKEIGKMAHVGEARHWGLMAGIELIEDKAKGKAYDWKQAMGVKVCRKARDYGVILRPLGPVVVLMPPLCITGTQLEKLLKVTRRSIVEVCGDK